MIGDGLSLSSFPAFDAGVRAVWAPILLEPIAGSYERLVVGVAAANGAEYVVLEANAMERLRCLLGTDGDTIMYAVRIAIDHLSTDLAARGVEAIRNPISAVSGVALAVPREGEGASLQALALSWLSQLSSLHDSRRADEPYEDEQPDEIEQTDGPADTLPTMILRYVAARQEGFTRYFSSELREGRARRGRSHEVHIDFAGSKLVANFGTLRASAIGQSVTLLKRRLWDLKVARDGQTGTAFHRLHEMIVYTPPPDDPSVSAKQRSNLGEALHALEEQSDQEQLRFRPLSSVPSIGERVLEAEAA